MTGILRQCPTMRIPRISFTIVIVAVLTCASSIDGLEQNLKEIDLDFEDEDFKKPVIAERLDKAHEDVPISDDEDKPRGFLAALAGFPDDFEETHPVAKKVVSRSAIKSKVEVESKSDTSSMTKSTDSLSDKSETEKVAPPPSNAESTDRISSENKNEDHPNKRNTGGQPLPFLASQRPAGYILWHPVPASEINGPIAAIRNQDQLNLAPQERMNGGGFEGGHPHQPFFIQPRPMANNNQFQAGTFPFAQFSPPPFFMLPPMAANQNTEKSFQVENNEKIVKPPKSKSNKNKNLNSQKPNQQKELNNQPGRLVFPNIPPPNRIPSSPFFEFPNFPRQPFPPPMQQPFGPFPNLPFPPNGPPPPQQPFQQPPFVLNGLPPQQPFPHDGPQQQPPFHQNGPMPPQPFQHNGPPPQQRPIQDGPSPQQPIQPNEPPQQQSIRHDGPPPPPQTNQHNGPPQQTNQHSGPPQLPPFQHIGPPQQPILQPNGPPQQPILQSNGPLQQPILQPNGPSQQPILQHNGHPTPQSNQHNGPPRQQFENSGPPQQPPTQQQFQQNAPTRGPLASETQYFPPQVFPQSNSNSLQGDGRLPPNADQTQQPSTGPQSQPVPPTPNPGPQRIHQHFRDPIPPVLGLPFHPHPPFIPHPNFLPPPPPSPFVPMQNNIPPPNHPFFPQIPTAKPPQEKFMPSNLSVQSFPNTNPSHNSREKQVPVPNPTVTTPVQNSASASAFNFAAPHSSPSHHASSHGFSTPVPVIQSGPGRDFNRIPTTTPSTPPLRTTQNNRETSNQQQQQHQHQQHHHQQQQKQQQQRINNNQFGLPPSKAPFSQVVIVSPLNTYPHVPPTQPSKSDHLRKAEAVFDHTQSHQNVNQVAEGNAPDFRPVEHNYASLASSSLSLPPPRPRPRPTNAPSHYAADTFMDHHVEVQLPTDKNYASPGFHSGYKGFPSAVTATTKKPVRSRGKSPWRVEPSTAKQLSPSQTGDQTYLVASNPAVFEYEVKYPPHQS